MSEHEIKVGCTKYGSKIIFIEDGEIQVGFETENEDVVGTAYCECGESFRELENAEEHLQEVMEE